jgi:hypothetical protein
LGNLVAPYFHKVVRRGKVTEDGSPGKGYPSDYLDCFPADNAELFCRSYGANTTREWIDAIQLDQWSRESGDNNGYLDATAAAYQNPEAAPQLDRGRRYRIELHPGFLHQPGEAFWNVWMDWNQNGRFEPSEKVLARSSETTVTTELEVPSKAVLGGFTLMRIQMKPGGFSNDPCAVFPAGEVEDYLVRVGNR